MQRFASAGNGPIAFFPLAETIYTVIALFVLTVAYFFLLHVYVIKLEHCPRSYLVSIVHAYNMELLCIKSVPIWPRDTQY